jgi:hypothetical protein
VDAYYGFNFNRIEGDAPLRNFDTQHNQFSLNMAEMILERKPVAGSRFGFRMDLDVGPTAEMVAAFEPAGAGSYSALQQGYVSVLAPVGSGLQVDVGKMVTPLGAEVIESQDNWNYSRSLLFTLAIPYYHMGARASYTFNERVSVSAWLVNGWNNVEDNNGAKTVAVQASIKPWSRLTIVQGYISGAEQAGDADDIRHVLDTVATVSVSDRLSIMANYDWGRDRVAGAAMRWQGLALYGRFQAAPWWAISPRFEWYDDQDGFTTGAAQTLRELTITSEQRLTGQLGTRVEFRRDLASEAVFATGSGEPTRTQTTVTVGVFYAFSTARP